MISYTRWSTPEQGAGHSKKRQTQMADAWAAKRGWVVDDSLRFIDRGVSGFHGKNESEGELGKLIAMAEGGKFPRGSYLVIEDFDRLSRQDSQISLRLLNRFSAVGITVVNLTDDFEYPAEQKGIAALMNMVRAGMAFERAHAESDRKSGMLLKSWESKRTAAAGKRMTSWCPAWLTPDQGQGFQLIPERVLIVRRIFSEFVGGRGVFAIAEGLRRSKIEPWGHIKSKARAKTGGVVVWHKSYIRKILVNPAVIGRGQPCKIDKSVPGQRVPVGPPIENYYPAAIPAHLWQEAEKRWRAIEAKQTSASGPRGNESGITSIFSGLLLCGRTGGAVVTQRKAASGPPRLYSVQAPGKYLGWSYDEFQTAALGVILETNAADIWPATRTSEERRKLQEQLALTILSRDGKTKAVAALLDSLEEIGASGAASIKERIDLRSQEIERMDAEIKEMQVRLDKLNGEAARAEDAVAAVRNLYGSRRQPEMRENLRRHVRDLVERIEVFFQRIPNRRELQVMAIAQTARKLLKLAKVRREKRGLTMEGFEFRHDAKRLRQALRIVKKLRDRRLQWAVITFKSGVTVSTRKLTPGMRLKEDPGVYMLEGDSDQLKGYLGLFVDPVKGYEKGSVPLMTIDTKPHPEAVAEMERFFGKGKSQPSEKATFEVIPPKRRKRLPEA